MPPILLIGHRGCGKSTLGAHLAAHLQLPFFDLDSVIETREGVSAAELVARDESGFREIEVQILAELLDAGEPCVIAAGAGLRHFPADVLIVHIARDGWEDVARRERKPLRPDLPFEEEVAWMRETRDPVYRLAAHICVRVSRGARIEDTLDMLRASVDLALASMHTAVMRKTWIVPAHQSLLQRCVSDTRLFGLAGIEIRSDLFSTPVNADVPVLASLRSEDAGFFRSLPSAASFDCDVRFIESAVLDDLAPRPLFISTHPNDVDKEFFDEMLDAAEKLLARYPAWRQHLRFKYAPRVKSWIEMRFAHEQCRVFARNGGRISLLPQGKAWNWMRAFRVWRLNELNYVWPGSEIEGNLPPSIAYFTPHAAGNTPDVVCGLIGDPVHDSAGDLWHRRASIEEDGGRMAYVKIPVPAAELEHALFFLLKLDLLGLSVTSPHKTGVIHSNFVTSQEGFERGNTLTLRDGGWLLTDSDRDGMAASLRVLRERGVISGSVAIFGQGGVIMALTDALRADGWTPMETVSARAGWGEMPLRKVALVVNAGPPEETVYMNPPDAEAWLDLAYRNIPRLPSTARVYLDGWTFFTAQAAVQRRVWRAELERRTQEQNIHQ